MTETCQKPRPTILIVDDDAEVRDILAETLEELGYGVCKACSGEEALPLLLTDRLKIDMVITDVRMPGMSGLDLVEEVRRRDAAMPFILISGYFVPQTVTQRVLKKPFHMRDLASAVRAELGLVSDLH